MLLVGASKRIRQAGLINLFIVYQCIVHLFIALLAFTQCPMEQRLSLLRVVLDVIWGGPSYRSVLKTSSIHS